MSEELPVSVIVPTYDREEVLCDTLKQLQNQSYESYDIHVVDHTKQHTDKTKKFLENLPDRFSHHQLSEGDVNHARNYGLKISTGNIVVFIDDDVHFDNTFVAEHAASYTDSTVVAVAGQVLTPYNDEPTNKKPIGRTTWYGRSKMRLNANKRGFVEEGRGCNMSFRRSALEAIDGFDEFLSFRDESDVFHRVRQHTAGRVLFNPGASVFHRETDSGGTMFGSQQSRKEFLEVTKYKTYYHLKNKSLLSLPVAIFSVLIFRIKQRMPKLYKVPNDIIVMMLAIKTGVSEWISRDN